MLDTWRQLARPPASALKQITGGRLKNMTDVNPQWRYQIMTDVFGECGQGWKFEVVDLWTTPAPDGQHFAFAKVLLSTFQNDCWCAPIPGIGGSMLVAKEAGGLHANDEAYKMAVTDALGTAMKMLGVAADVYAGLWDGSKYREAPAGRPAAQPASPPPPAPPPPQNRSQSQPRAPQGQAVVCPKCGGPVWDNRATKTNPKAPDGKCRNKNCTGAIWQWDQHVVNLAKMQEDPQFAFDQAADAPEDLGGEFDPGEGQ